MAGCTVGRPYPKEVHLDQRHPAYLLPTYMEECHTIDGRSFACDTNFRAKERLSVDEIIDLVPTNVERFCITGGEPLMHDLSELVVAAMLKKKKIHIETSGTIGLMDLPTHKQDEIWVTCSPKLGARPDMLKRANEIKLLVDENFDVTKLPDEIMEHPLVWIQPINEEMNIRRDHLKLVIDLQKEFPKWRISLQLHKVLSHYLCEVVR